MTDQRRLHVVGVPALHSYGGGKVLTDYVCSISYQLERDLFAPTDGEGCFHLRGAGGALIDAFVHELANLTGRTRLADDHAMVIHGAIARSLFEEGRLDGVLGPLGAEARRWWESGLLMHFNGLPLYVRSLSAVAGLVLEGPRPLFDYAHAWPPVWTGSIVLCSRERIPAPASSGRDLAVIELARKQAGR